jgi:CheY-like chemotaxis protein
MLAYSGRGHVIVRPLDLNLSVEEMIHLLQVTLSKKTELALDLAPNLPPVLADPAQIQQVVLNLVTNAAEAIGHRAGTITLRTYAETLDGPGLEELCPAQGLEPGTYALLEVIDTGCGMGPDLVERIFDPFFTTKPTGHGLGLSAIHGILKTHRAGLRIQSSPGEGTTFQILFPVTEERPPLLTNEDSAPRKVFQGWALVADDEPMVLDFAVAALESMGFDVLPTKDGAEALASFQKTPDRFRLALLDLTMPRMDGLETFAELRRLRPSLPVILSSGYDADAAAQGLVALGQVRFLPKPYPVRELRRMVTEALEEASLERPMESNAEAVRFLEPPSPEA